GGVGSSVVLVASTGGDAGGVAAAAAWQRRLPGSGWWFAKSNKKSLKAKGKGKANGKGKDKKVYIPKPKNPKPAAKEHPTKDDTSHHCKEEGHWKRNCHVYLAELLKKKKQVGSASSSGLLKSTDDKSFDQCVSCLSGEMTRKSFLHRPKRVTDLLGIIHTDVCGPECLSCGALYTGNFCCSKRNVEDKILVPKLPKNCARCARCGHPVNGPYCQGCTLLREKLEEDLVTYFQNFQNTSESSDGSTNCRPTNEDYYHEQNSCYNSNSFGFDHCQPPQYTVNHLIFDAHNDLLSSRTTLIEQMTQLSSMCEMVYQIVQKKQEEKWTEEEQAANAQYWKIPTCCDDDDDYNSAITPVLSTEEPDNSLSMGDEHLDTIPATESDEVIKFSVEDLVPIPSESEGIPNTMCDVHLVNNPTPLEAKDHFESVINSNDDISSSDDDSLYNENIEYVEGSPHDSELVSLEVAEIVILEDEEIEDDNLREKLLNVNLLIAKIEALEDNPNPSSEFLTKSSSTSLKSFLEETNTFHNSLPEFENFCFDLEEISSGSTTTHSDISLLNYEVFYFHDDHIEEISSGSTTTHSDIYLSEYDSFIFDLSNDQFPPTDRSDLTHEEFTGELTHIISPPEYDRFYFRNFPDQGELISILNSGIRENLSTTCVNLRVEDDHFPLLAYVVWIFLAYLTYPVIPPYIHSFRNEDTIFDPGITINHFCSFKPGLSHRCGTFKKFNTHRSHLNESPMEMLFSTCSLMDQ
nr:zinc finger, CCHC-type [Tanacetum cinerariifolium]